MKRETTTTKIIEESEQNIFIFFADDNSPRICMPMKKYVDVLADFRIRELTDLIARFE